MSGPADNALEGRTDIDQAMSELGRTQAHIDLISSQLGIPVAKSKLDIADAHVKAFAMVYQDMMVDRDIY